MQGSPQSASGQRDSLLQVEHVTDPLNPTTYLVSHLLASGFAGGEYQLIILLAKLTGILAEDSSAHFEAVVEIAEHGNLDDLAIILLHKKKQTALSVHAYQAKYYKEPISVYSFFNEPEAEAKTTNAKMHIGKFFSGWLAWKKEYPYLDNAQLRSVVFCNQSLDADLRKCVANGSFNPEFLSGVLKVQVGRNAKVKPRVNKNFLAILNPEIGQYQSGKIWTKLFEAGYINKDKFLTDKYQLDSDLNDANIPAKYLVAVKQALADTYQADADNKVDLYTLLYDEAWQYLEDKNDAPEGVTTGEARKQLFKQFLTSFDFQVAQLNLRMLEEEILKNISKIISAAPEPIFLALYHVIHDWFIQGRDGGQVPKLTAEDFKKLLKQAQLRSQDLLVLQGRNSAILDNVPASNQCKLIVRAERQRLKSLIAQPGIVKIWGDTGIGKTTLVKQALENVHPSEYLVFDTYELISNHDLQKLLNELKSVNSIRVIVLDNADILSSLPAEQVTALFRLLHSLANTVVLTSTRNIALTVTEKVSALEVKKLAERHILESFPQFQEYKCIKPIWNLIQIPLYLQRALTLIEELRASTSNHHAQKFQAKAALRLAKFIVRGFDAKLNSDKKIAWQQLAYQIATSENSVNRALECALPSPGIEKLIAEGIVLSVKQNNTHHLKFCDEMFFMHGLMLFVFNQWRAAKLKSKAEKFWQKILKYFSFLQGAEYLKKWLILYFDEIKKDLLEHVDVLINNPHFYMFIMLAIEMHDNTLLATLLDLAEPIILKELLSSSLDRYGVTFVLLAIQCNNALAVDLLLQYGSPLHDPAAGHLRLTEFSACYIQESTSSDEDIRSSPESSDAVSCGLYSQSSDGEHNSDGEYHEEDEGEDIVTRFIRDPNKYWLAGFNEEPGEHDDEGVWVANPYYQARPNYQHSYLHQAVLLRSVACLEALLEHAARIGQSQVVNLQNGYEETLLHIAVLRNAEDCVDSLLEYGASVNSTDTWGETPLHNAVYQGNIAIAAKLLEAGANPNALSYKTGLSPYHLAFVQLNFEMVELLFKYGGDLSVKAFDFLGDGVHIADLVDRVYFNERGLQGKSESFAKQLFELHCFGEDVEEFEWGCELIEIDAAKRKAQLKEVYEFKDFLGENVELSEWHPGFNYEDEASKLDHAIEIGDFELLEELTDFVLDDPDNIESVLLSDAFQHLEEEIIEMWLNDSSINKQRYLNLIAFAEDNNRKDLATRLSADLEYFSESSESGSDEESDDDDDEDDKRRASTWPLASTLFFAPSISQQSTHVLQPNAKKTYFEPWQELSKAGGLEYLLARHNKNVERLASIDEADLLAKKFREENLTLELLIQEKRAAQQAESGLSNDNQIQVVFNDELLTFTKQPTTADGWCGFYAAGLDSPENCIQQMIELAQDNSFCQELAYIILQNYMASLAKLGLDDDEQVKHVEHFSLGKQFIGNLQNYFAAWQDADETNQSKAYNELLDYLSQRAIVISYLNHLRRDKYANCATIKLYCQRFLNTQLGVVIRYGEQYYLDIPTDNEGDIRYVLYEPNASMATAHYSKLTLQVTNTAKLMPSKP